MVDTHKSGPSDGKYAPSRSFAPILRRDARILVLGSLPGRRSLAESQYYAHPQNAFWRVMHDVLGVSGDYGERCEAILDRGVAVWDVLQESVRPGSMDADIRIEDSQANDFKGLFERTPELVRVCFNGRKAAALYGRFVGDTAAPRDFEYLTLPSTSPAYAAMPYTEKLERWRAALDLGG